MEDMVSLVLYAGELLLTCGAEMYRVEETIERMGKAAGFSQVEVFATPTGLFISLHTLAGRVYTRVRRIRSAQNNLEVIAEVNSLSREFSQGLITAGGVREKLSVLADSVQNTDYKRCLAGGLGAGAFTLMYQGGFLESLLAAAIGALVLILTAKLGQYPVPTVLKAAVGAITAAALALVLGSCAGLNVNLAVLGSVMVLAPGVVMTTAVRDLLSGELVSGVSRAAEALAVAVAVATGVAVVLSIGGG